MIKSKSTLVKGNNQRVLATIRECGPINKAEIARLNDLSIPTAMKITDELLNNGVIVSCGKQESGGKKRAEMYRFAGDSFFSLGIDIAPTAIRVLVMDLDGTTLHKEMRPTDITQQPQQIIKDAADLAAQVLYDSKVSFDKVLGVGVAVPGILDLDEGSVLFSPNFHWEDVSLVDLLKSSLLEKTGIHWPVKMENSNRMQALGVQYFDSGAGCEYFISINLGYGIGSAIVENEMFYEGASGTSGEIGHITVEKDGALCTCGNNGCLEAMASGRALAQQAQNLITSGITTKILDLVDGEVGKVQAKTVFEAARQGDTAALNLVHKAGEYIGIGLASYINLLDPQKIVLAGGMAHEEILVDEIMRVSKKRRMRFAGRKVSINISHLGEYATAVGAASIHLKQLLETASLTDIEA